MEMLMRNFRTMRVTVSESSVASSPGWSQIKDH